MLVSGPNDVVVVSGLPRSGTSLMMAILEAAGLPLLVDDLRPPDRDNPRGYFEYRGRILPLRDRRICGKVSSTPGLPGGGRMPHVNPAAPRAAIQSRTRKPAASKSAASKSVASKSRTRVIAPRTGRAARSRELPMVPERQLGELRSVGPATIADLAVLGIHSVAELATREPGDLYRELCERTGAIHDPCCEDVFAAAIAQARDPNLCGEQTQWWYWSRLRKQRR